MEQFLLDWSYTGIAAFVWGTGMGFPIPEDIILLMAGWVCAKEAASMWIMVPLVYISIIGSDSFIYWLGLRFGHHVPKMPLVRTMLSEKKLAMAEVAFHKHGSKTVFITRLTPLIRAPIYFTAGAFKFPYWKFVLSDGLAALIGTPIVIVMGYLGANQIEKMKEYSHTAQIIIFSTVALGVIGFIAWHHWRAKQLEEAAKQLDPILHHHIKEEEGKPKA
jgi:membrane protein DedA with SNARE-associated domain